MELEKPLDRSKVRATPRVHEKARPMLKAYDLVLETQMVMTKDFVIQMVILTVLEIP